MRKTAESRYPPRIKMQAHGSLIALANGRFDFIAGPLVSIQLKSHLFNSLSIPASMRFFSPFFHAYELGHVTLSSRLSSNNVAATLDSKRGVQLRYLTMVLETRAVQIDMAFVKNT